MSCLIRYCVGEPLFFGSDVNVDCPGPVVTPCCPPCSCWTGMLQSHCTHNVLQNVLHNVFKQFFTKESFVVYYDLHNPNGCTQKPIHAAHQLEYQSRNSKPALASNIKNNTYRRADVFKRIAFFRLVLPACRLLVARTACGAIMWT